MTDKKRVAKCLLAALLALWGAGKLFGLYQIHFPNRSHPMIPLLQDMQTFCVGSYLIDLPRGSVILSMKTDINMGQRSAEFLVNSELYPCRSRSDFQHWGDTRWAAIQAMKPEGNMVFDQPPQRTEPVPDGVVMTFKHHTADLGHWPDGTSGPQPFYDIEGYLWRGGTLYVFGDRGNNKEGVTEAMKALQPRRDDEIPIGAGFCGGRSFFPGRPDADDYVEFVFRLPTETDTEFRIDMPTGRSPHPDMARYVSDDVKFKKLREASRTQAGLEGSEWMEYSWIRSADWDRAELSADWFGHLSTSTTTRPDNGFPGVELKLDAYSKTDDEGAPPPKLGKMIVPEGGTAMSIEEFTALWDAIVSSLRPRPGAGGVP
ncbi:MAG: hypothetical protein LBU76_04595 [Azoarcus sp.]|jgi:hypothetical protein|nr:hypothetical protein [Azoarcus sp.]